MGAKRTLVAGVALLLGVLLLWRTRALLTLAIAVILGARLAKLVAVQSILHCVARRPVGRVSVIYCQQECGRGCYLVPGL